MDARRAGVALALVASLVAGCGDDDGESDETDRSPPTATTDRTANPTVPDTGSQPLTTARVDYAAQFLAWTTPLNCAVAEASDAAVAIMGDDRNLEQDEWDDVRGPLAEVYAKLAAAMEAAIDEGSELAWPPELQADVEALLEEIAQTAAATELLADAQTADQWFTRSAALSKVPHTASSPVRSKLGLATDIRPDEACS